MSNRITLYADDISCNHCAMTIKRELANVEGIKVLEVDVASKAVVLEYTDENALDRARAILQEVGYPVRAA